MKQTPPAGVPDDTAREAFIVSAYDEHHAAVFAFLARSTRDLSTAEGLLQETYLGLTKEVHYDAPPLEVRSALFRIASNLVIEQHGRPTTSGGRIDPRSRARVRTSDATTDIEQALAGLSVDARVALLLSSEGFTGEEIAAAIGRSIPATRTLLYLARSRVRVRRELFAAAGP